MITPAHSIFQILVVEGFCKSIEDMPRNPAERDPNVWYAVSCLKMPDFEGCPNNLIGVLDMDYVQAERSNYIADGIPLDQANVKICVRTTEYADGLAKIHHIARTLDTLKNYVVSIPNAPFGDIDPFDKLSKNNSPRYAEVRTVLTCTRLETIRDRGEDATMRRFLFDVTYTVRFA